MAVEEPEQRRGTELAGKCETVDHQLAVQPPGPTDFAGDGRHERAAVHHYLGTAQSELAGDVRHSPGAPAGRKDDLYAGRLDRDDRRPNRRSEDTGLVQKRSVEVAGKQPWRPHGRRAWLDGHHFAPHGDLSIFISSTDWPTDDIGALAAR